MLPAPPAVPVAVNVTGLPVSPLAVAVSVLVPAVVPSVQLPTLAMPLALVVWLAPVMLPLPGATANVTVTPPTGLPPPSFTITDGWIGTVPPTGAVCLSPPLIAICVAGPAVTVTVVDVTVPSWGAVKLRVRAPAMPVMVRLVNVAVPELLVAIGFAPLNAGPPLASAAVTATPMHRVPGGVVQLQDRLLRERAATLHAGRWLRDDRECARRPRRQRDAVRADRGQPRGDEAQRVAPRRPADGEPAERGPAARARRRAGRRQRRAARPRRDHRGDDDVRIGDRVAARVLHLDGGLRGEGDAALRGGRRLRHHGELPGRSGRDLERRARLAQGARARPQRVALPHALDREVRERGHTVHRGERRGAAQCAAGGVRGERHRHVAGEAHHRGAERILRRHLHRRGDR